MKRTGGKKRVHLRGCGEGLVSQGGVELLYRAARVSGLEAALSAELAGFRKARSDHDPGKVVLDLAVMLAAGGDCPADTAMLRGREPVFGPVASDPTISRTVHAPPRWRGDGRAACCRIAERRSWSTSTAP